MVDFRVLEHTADVGFEAFGASREDVFRNAGRALMSLVVPLESVRPARRIPVAARAAGPEDLLVNWLSEILYLQDAEGWLFSEFESVRGRGDAASGLGVGGRFERGRHQVNLLVKAITYYQLALEERPGGGWRAQVYVDI